MKNPSKTLPISDEKLYLLCKRFGSQALTARRKFAGLLPEVFRRKLFEKKSFSSIYEFAAKLAGMSREQVDVVLRLDRRFESMPILRKALNEGEVSASKLVRIASVATTENQKEIFEKTKILSNKAVEVFVKDIRYAQNIENKTSKGFCKPLFDQKTLRTQTLKLDEDVENELIKMQEKGIDVNEFLRNTLKKQKEEIEQEKAKITAQQDSNETKSTGVSNSRYISAQIKNILKREHGNLCSVPNCQKPAKIIHHMLPFSLAHSHDPRFLAPLCQEHHKIAHLANITFAEINLRR